MSSLHALRDEARRYLAAGKNDKAARTYTKLRRLEPDNPRWAKKLGEAYQRMDEVGEAVLAFTAAAELFAAEGFLLKAIALCKVVLGLEPSHVATQERLAELYAKRYPQPVAKVRPAEALEVAATPSAGEGSTGADAPLPIVPTAYAAAELEEPDPEPEPQPEPALEPVGELEIDIAAPAPIPITIELDATSSSEHQTGGSDQIVLEEAEASTVAAGARNDEVGLIAVGDSLASIDISLVVEALPPERRAELEGAAPAEQRQEGIFELNLDDELIDAAFEAIEAPVTLPPGGTAPAPAEELLDSLPPTPLFSSLDRAALRLLIETVEVLHFAPGERILRQGASGNALYVLVEGSVTVWREGPPRVEIGRLEEGAFFGEIALLTKRVRSATVEALEECTVLEVSREVMGRLIEEHPAVLRVLLRFFRERLIDTLIDTHELFAPFAGPDRESLARRFSFIEVAKSTVLSVQGEPMDGLYVLLSGQAIADREGGATTLLGPGDLFGETSLLTEEHAVATITTDEKCWCLRMPKGVFRETIMTHPHVLAVLADVSAQRRAARRAQLAGGSLDESRIPLL